MQYLRPAEWQKGKAICLAWPFDKNLWQRDLLPAQKEFIALVHALHEEHLIILFHDEEERKLALSQIAIQKNINTLIMPYADIWLRDTLPIFIKDHKNDYLAVIPQFNGWGKKYLFSGDKDLSKRFAKSLELKTIDSSIVFEGGAIECDGLGTLISTEQCLLNKNRNPHLSKSFIEHEFAHLFGAKKVIWLKEGLKNDHTDGHVDTIARFIAPHKVAIMIAKDKSDPNYEVLQSIKEQLLQERDASDQKLELIELPSPGMVLNRQGNIMPASYLNFIIADHVVIVPTYGVSSDQEALKLLSSHFTRPTIALSAKAILSGGGAFHCISQEIYR